MKWAIINDGAHRFGLKTYYIAPFSQIQQLKELGFRNIHQYSLDNGEEIIDNTPHLKEINDSWIYYECRI